MCIFWILKSNTDISYKDTHTGQFNNDRDQTAWKLKISWIKALYHSAHKTCSSKRSLNKQIRIKQTQIKMYMSWNGYSKRVQNSVIKRLEKNRSRPRLTDDDRKKIWLNLPYNEKLGEKLSIE